MDDQDARIANTIQGHIEPNKQTRMLRISTWVTITWVDKGLKTIFVTYLQYDSDLFIIFIGWKRVTKLSSKEHNG